MTLTPEPEQIIGADWLAPRPQAILGDVPGYGKTGQALLAAAKNSAQRVVVACPAIARVNWAREADKWGLGLPVIRVTEPDDHTLPAYREPMLVIASYDAIAKSAKLRGALNAYPWDVAIFDEAHRLKSPEANRTKAVYGNRVNGQRCLADKALHRWLLSGSITPNHAGELWTHLSALWPDLIRDMSGRVMGYDQFLERYMALQYSEFGPKVVGYRDREGLVALLQQIMLRRDEIKGLPPLVLREDPTIVEVTSDELAQFEAEHHEELEELRSVLLSAQNRADGLEGIEDEFIHLATLRRLTGVLKARPVADLVLSETGPDNKVVLFGIHREVIEKIECYLAIAGEEPAMVHGGVPDGQRNIEIDRFNEDPKCRFFIGQIEACKEVINLQAANQVRMVEQSWCPNDNFQAIARAHRRGQRRQVFADAIAIAGSIDETTQRCCTLKTRMIQQLMKERYQ